MWVIFDQIRCRLGQFWGGIDSSPSEVLSAWANCWPFSAEVIVGSTKLQVNATIQGPSKLRVVSTNVFIWIRPTLVTPRVNLGTCTS